MRTYTPGGIESLKGRHGGVGGGLAWPSTTTSGARLARLAGGIDRGVFKRRSRIYVRIPFWLWPSFCWWGVLGCCPVLSCFGGLLCVMCVSFFDLCVACLVF